MPARNLVPTGNGHQRACDGEQAKNVTALHVVVLTAEEGRGTGGRGRFDRLFFDKKSFQIREGDT
ncbi:hypothetical protein [Streptomyces sp. NPDC001108]